MIAPGSPTVRRRRLAAELRGIREDKGKSGDAVAAALKWSPSKISRYERARTGLRPREVERLLDYYQITGSHRACRRGHRPAPDGRLRAAHHQQLQPGRAGRAGHGRAAGAGPDAPPAGAE